MSNNNVSEPRDIPRLRSDDEADIIVSLTDDESTEHSEAGQVETNLWDLEVLAPDTPPAVSQSSADLTEEEYSDEDRWDYCTIHDRARSKLVYYRIQYNDFEWLHETYLGETTFLGMNYGMFVQLWESYMQRLSMLRSLVDSEEEMPPLVPIHIDGEIYGDASMLDESLASDLSMRERALIARYFGQLHSFYKEEDYAADMAGSSTCSSTSSSSYNSDTTV